MPPTEPTPNPDPRHPDTPRAEPTSSVPPETPGRQAAPQGESAPPRQKSNLEAGKEPYKDTAANRRSSFYMPATWLAIVLIGLMAILIYWFDRSRLLTYSEFETVVASGELKQLTLLGRESATGEVHNPESDLAKQLKLLKGKFSVNLPVMQDQTQFLERLKTIDSEFRAKATLANPEFQQPPLVLDKQEEPLPWLIPLLWFLLPALLMIGLFSVFILPRMRDPMGGSFLSQYVRSPAKRYEKSRGGRTTFQEVAGMESAKQDLQELVEFLKNPDKFSRLGAQVPKGVLLIGPPGTGKTLLARAVAGEANVPFYSINGSEFIQMFVGVGASRVRDLFKIAKENAPCVVFIDEIDAVGRVRGAGVGGGSDEREQTLNQILSEMDGFQANETVIILAATNRPDVLDPALLRPGRFDRHVTVNRPTWQGRLEILKVHTRNKPLADEIDLEKIARGAIGMSGAELKNLCNEAALHATRLGKSRIDQSDFLAAYDKVLLGAKREEVLAEDEKRRTAYHEAGHALCAWLEPKADPLTRVSIIPRGRTGGVTILEPKEDRVDVTRSECLARLVVLLGGRAADQLIFGEPMSGAIMDLKQATKIAKQMVTQFGMSDRLGPVHYRIGEEHVFLGKEMTEMRDFSEGTARIIDEEVQRILTEAQTRATRWLVDHREDLDALVEALLRDEEIDRAAVDAILRKAPRPEGTQPGPADPQAATTELPDRAPPGSLAFGNS